MKKNTLFSLFLLVLVYVPALGDGSASLVREVTNSTLGKVINVLPIGLTLYSFDMDTAANSACQTKCAEVWPPYTLSDGEVQQLQAPFTVIKRASGLNQLVYEGKPLYIFHLDRKEGDILGDGIGGVWHVVE